jgi:ABC-2 type transport system permease protein
MPSKMSLFNKELILQIGRSTGWVSIVYFLGLLFTLPIDILMIYSDENLTHYWNEGNLFRRTYDFQIGLIVIVPVVLAVFLFRYLHVKQAADLMHSLPMKRNQIYHHYALTGMFFLITPVVLISIILIGMHSSLDLSIMFSVNDILYWAGTTIVITLLLYGASVFIAMMTGISAVSAVLSYIFLFFPVGMTLLIFYNLKLLLYGFPSDYFLNRQLETLSPITYATVLNRKTFQWSEASIYLILTIILYVLALFFYKKRKLEAASEAIAFAKLRSVFKYGVAFCVMLFGGSYFSQVSNNTFSWIVFGYVIGAVIGYYVAEMVLQKSWRVFTRVKGLVIYLAVIALLVIGGQGLGIYENRVPEGDEVKSVVLTDNPYLYMNHEDLLADYYSLKPMKDQMNIDGVRMLHQKIIADKNINQQSTIGPSINLLFRYKLENGSHITREYRVNPRLYEEFFKPIYESKEYKFSTKEIFNLKEHKIKNLTIRANGPVSKGVTLSGSDEIREVISALREDVLAESYEDNIYFQSRGSQIEINMGQEQFLSLEFRPNYQNLSKWLKEKNLLEQAKVTANDISHVLVAKVESAGSEVDIEKIIRDVEEGAKPVDVTDKGQIEILLGQTSSDYTKEYKAVFYYKLGNHPEVMVFDEEHLPDFLKGQLK